VGRGKEGDVAQAHSSIRVALVGCTGLLGDVICQTVTTETDMDIVAELTTPTNDVGISALEADIVIWNDADEHQIDALLRTSGKHSPPVLATLTDGQQAALWKLTPRRTELGALSPQTLVKIIRETAGRP
jgi:hypothetical protein